MGPRIHVTYNSLVSISTGIHLGCDMMLDIVMYVISTVLRVYANICTLKIKTGTFRVCVTNLLGLDS